MTAFDRTAEIKGLIINKNIYGGKWNFMDWSAMRNELKDGTL